MLPPGRSNRSRSRRPCSSSSVWTRSSAMARFFPAAARGGGQHLAAQVRVEPRASRGALAEEHEVDLAIRLLAEVEGGEARRGLGGHVEREPRSVGLAVAQPVLQLL